MNLDISLRAVNDRVAFPIIEEGGERGGGWYQIPVPSLILVHPNPGPCAVNPILIPSRAS